MPIVRGTTAITMSLAKQRQNNIDKSNEHYEDDDNDDDDDDDDDDIPEALQDDGAGLTCETALVGQTVL